MTAKDKFFRFISEWDMLAAGDSVLVGFSGGADSMCLMDMLLNARDKLGITIGAAHVNHGIRGREADADEAFVRQFCEDRDVKLHILHADIPALAKKNRESEELCARRVRYDYFASLRYDKIATAHTGSDAVETMLMNLSRGSALHGLASIPPKRNNIIRPLLSLTRSEVEAYCKENNLSFVTDSTNASDYYTRNRFRHAVVPAFKEINHTFEASALRCIEALRREDDYLDYVSACYLTAHYDAAHNTLQLAELRDLHCALRYRILGKFISVCSGADYEERHLALLDDHLSESFTLILPGAVRVSVRDDLLIASRQFGSPVSQVLRVCFDKHSEGVYSFGEEKICVSLHDYIFDNKISFDSVDFSKIDDIIVLREKAPGDKITLAHRRCSKTLKKLFSEAKIPVEDRRRIPVLADKNGVIWVRGFGVNASRLPDPDTKKILTIKTESGNNDK